MGRITVFLMLTVLFTSVCASKIGGSYGHVKHREINIPRYAKNSKHSLRNQDDKANNDDAASGPHDNDAEPTFENPPEEEALPEKGQSDDENNVNAENSPINDDQEQPGTALDEGNEADPDKEDPLEGNINDVESPNKVDLPSDGEDENVVIRGIQAGDTFTPHELLPVTQKLIAKVENPGEGKGIVSSAKNPEDLADVLFESFFLGPHRIVILEDKDIIGLDALQALAISGEEARRMPAQVTAPSYLLNIEDQIVNISPRTSKYLLLRKSNSTKIPPKNAKKMYKFRSRKDKRMIKRRAPNTSRQKLISKLQKKRKLVLNPVRKNNKINKTKIIGRSGVFKTKKTSKTLVNPVHNNIKHKNTKVINSIISTKVNKGVQPKVKSARKYDKINKAKTTKKVAPAKGAKPAKGTRNPKNTQRNQRSFKKNGTTTSNVADKPDKANKQKNSNKNRNKSIMLDRIKGNPATPRPSSGTTVHRTSTLCRWRYECTDPGDLDSCKLHTQCNVGNLKATTNADFIGPVRTDKEMRDLRKFHKMIGFSLVDEEVEKILEARIMQFKPSLSLEKTSRIESLAQYFNNIIVAQIQSTTEAQSNNYDESTMANDDSKNSAQDEAVSGDEKRTLEGEEQTDSRRKENKMAVPHTGRPFLKTY